MAAELNADGVVSKRYTRGIQLICDSSDRYYMHNAHGDVVESFSGAFSSVHNYTAYGTQGYCENDDMDTFGYCGQQYDWETGNYYMRARYYNPDTGRFISEDTHWNPLNMIYGDKEYEEGERKYPDITASLQAANLYGYCMGNPLRYKDLSGNISEKDIYYDYNTTKDLTICSVEYNNAKIKGDKAGMQRAMQKAEGIRINAKKNEVDIDKMGLVNAILANTDNAQECRDMAMIVSAAYSYADGTNYAKGSLEYGLIVTMFMLDALERYKANKEIIESAQALYSNYVSSGDINEALFISSLPDGTVDTLELLGKTQQN